MWYIILCGYVVCLICPCLISYRNILTTANFSDPWGDNTANTVDSQPVYATVDKSKKKVANDPWGTPAKSEPPEELFPSDPLPPSDFVTPTMDPWGSSVTTSEPPARNDE